MDLIKKIYKKDRLIRFANFLLGITLCALAFNIFLRPNGLVSGLSGISIITEKEFNFTPFIFILVVNIFLIILSFILLGKEKTKNSVIGAILYPIMIAGTGPIADYINLGTTETIVLTVCGAAISGFGLGLVFKSGYTSGGTDIIDQILHKYLKISVGTAILIVNCIICLLTLYTLGFDKFIYSIIYIYIVSLITDKVLLGISNSKSIYVITEKEEEIEKFILKNLSHGVTILEGKGAYTGDNKKVIMCTIPTREYFILKEGIKEIDEKAFVLATDAYEVLGGK